MKPPDPVHENEPTTSKAEAPPPPPVGMTGDIASQLAAVSDHATQSCGYIFDEKSGYYYDHNTGLYYDQVVPLLTIIHVMHKMTCTLIVINSY